MIFLEPIVKLRIGFTRDGRMMAIAYEVHNKQIIVQDLEIVKNEVEAREWYARVILERPWITRQ